jgi:hypothetical protein
VGEFPINWSREHARGLAGPKLTEALRQQAATSRITFSGAHKTNIYAREALATGMFSIINLADLVTDVPLEIGCAISV